MTEKDLSSETLMQFPCEFTLKVVGYAGEQFEKTAITIVREHIPHLSDQALMIRESANGKYASLTIKFTAESRTQLDNLYQALSASSDILMAL